jgi:hypothetical protein
MKKQYYFKSVVPQQSRIFNAKSLGECLLSSLLSFCTNNFLKSRKIFDIMFFNKLVVFFG